MRFLIMLEAIGTGFSVQVPDLAIVICGDSIEAAKQAAVKAIKINLEAYREANQKIPERKSVLSHLENPDFKDLLFTYVDLTESRKKIAA